MDTEPRSRSGVSRSGSRRNQRPDWRSNGNQKASSQGGYSSSEEEEETGRGFRVPTKTGGAGSGRARVTPSDLLPKSESDPYEKPRFTNEDPKESNMSQAAHYYQEVSQGHFGNNLDEYESPVVKNSRRPPSGRRMGPNQVSSLSSSDNNSDTTYAESDINNSLRARMTALDNAVGTPPDPAPPEVPPRGPSHHHPLLTAQRRTGGPHGPNNTGSPHYQDPPGEDGYQQAPNVFLSQGYYPTPIMRNGVYPESFLYASAEECEYLMSGTSPRYGGSGMSKSPGAPSVYGPSPTREYIPSDFSQSGRILGTMDPQKGYGPGTGNGGGVGLTTLPVMNNLSLASRASFSSRGLHLGKTWRERFSWKCGAIFLIILAAILIALLAYFAAAYASLDSSNKGCIVVEDAAKVIAAGIDSDATTTSHPTPSYTEAFTTAKPKASLKHMPPASDTTHLHTLGRRYFNNIPPQGYWHIQFDVKQLMFLMFNLTIPRSSQLAIYGRRNAAPSITQYEFVEFTRGGRLGRIKREIKETMIDDNNLERSYVTPIEYLPSFDDVWIEKGKREPDEALYYPDYLHDYYHSETIRGGRSKRYLNEREVNISLVEQVDTGTLYLSIYNDGLGYSQVSLLVEEVPEVESVCPMGCSGHGSCVLGRCKCVQGWVGDDCSKNVCPVLCSDHGNYGGGVCHCHRGWKGRECDIPSSDCEVPDCNSHGTCISGICRCQPGWKGEACDEVDCADPKCNGHGWCVEGSCVCRAGWTGSNCSTVDHKVFTCLPDCSGNGHYDLHTSSCVCDAYWSGAECSEARCTLDCVHGSCNGNICTCESGWTGVRCDQRTCDPRCEQHGQCLNGTCLCIQGWNGKHCTIPGCVNSCSGNGLCSTLDGVYRCSCSPGWTGADCSVALETECTDNIDNDGDGTLDCNDSECCSTDVCKTHVMCMVSSDPVEVLLRKQPPSLTASFYQRVKFIIEDKNVQGFARKDEFTERRVSVIRGRVVTSQGQGIVGVRTSVNKEPKYGITATRKGGWFDLLLNGGGAVTLQFQRAHFEPLTVTVPILWNEIVVLEPVVMRLKDQPEGDHTDSELLWSDPCIDHNYKAMKPQVVSTYVPHAVGSASESSVVFTETQVVQQSLTIPGSDLHLIYHSSSVPGYMSTLMLQLTPNSIPSTLSMVHLKITLEGIVFEKIFEADPNITYTFAWNKRNVYKQKVYGESTAKIAVGYEYMTCNQIVWEVQTAKLHGFHMDISDIGGWNLDIHHMYNFERGLLQRGDGSTLNLRDSPRLVEVLMGNGAQRPVTCRRCSGLATDASLLSPVTLASGPDGSVYVGDFNLVRKISNRMVSTVLQLGNTKMSYGYHLAISPADGKVYVSDPEKYRIIRLLSVSNVTNPLNNFEVVAGSGERCVPGDERRCGDKGSAKNAKLAHPKGIAISADGTIYIADGTNIRMIDVNGDIHTLIGHHGHKSKWRPLPCSGGIPANQVELQWPTSLALSTLDNSLHILDDHVVLQVTLDGSVRVKAGTPLHCESSDEHPAVGTITGFSFAPSGSLLLAEEQSTSHHSVRELTPSGQLKHFAGVKPEDCGCAPGEKCVCRQDKVPLSSKVLIGSISAITVSYDGTVHIADQPKLQILSFVYFVPSDDQNGDYKVAYPKTNELYVFNRHGHHTETRDLATGRRIYSFLYSKNTSFGRLSKVTDSSSNKIMFLRDYKSAVSQIENTAGEKFSIEISRVGLMTRFSERPDRHHDFTYYDDTGLLLAETSPGRLTTVYEYDTAGRLQTIISPTGNRLNLDSWLAGSESLKHLAVGIGIKRFENEDAIESQVISLVGDYHAVFTHGKVHGELESWSNNTWKQTLPWGGLVEATSSSSNSLLEVILPTQARLLTVPQQFGMTAFSNQQPNILVTSYGVVEGGSLLEERLVEKVLLVNGTRVLNRRWKGVEQTEYLMDGDTKPLLEVSYNSNGQPTSFILGKRPTSVSISYDKFGRIASRQWEKQGEEYDYDSNGLLSAITTSSSAVTSYEFGENRLLKTITLPSGRSWGYHYDKRGGLKFIRTPSGSAHIFSVQPSFGSFIFSYTPPGGSHPYNHHLGSDGRLKLTVSPGGFSKVLYTYTDAGQLKEIVSGDGKTEFIYGDDSLISEVKLDENDMEYRWDYLYKGRLLIEHLTDYGARTSLSNVKIMYDYDSHFRMTQLKGRVGGKTIPTHEYEYDATTGASKRIGTFQITRHRNETLIQDGTATFSRFHDSKFRVVRLSVTIHNMEVFSLDIEYRRDGKISQTNTYTRNFHSKTFSNSKNYTYDADGQLTSVDTKKPWHFTYDANGNMLSLAYSTNVIPMQYDAQDRLVKFGKGICKHDSRGAMVQNTREVNFQYNARGLLRRASKSGRFSIRYFYDHSNRLIARKDNFGNVTQFVYADPRFPKQVTNIYNPRDGNLVSLLYDDYGHVIFAQVHRNKYYIATDECGSPITLFNQYGEVVREIMRSPYGLKVYDTNPYLYLPIDYCGGVLETMTELVHMPNGKVYDPLIGLWMYPEWEKIPENFMTPTKLSLYRFNGNDPINVGTSHWRNFGYEEWLSKMGYNMASLAPQLPLPQNIGNSRNLWNSFTQEPSQHLLEIQSPFKYQVTGTNCISGFVQNQRESLKYAAKLASFSPSLLRKDFWPDNHKFEISTTPGPFGEGVLVSTVAGKAIVTATAQANPIFRDVLSSVFNSTELLDVVLTSRNSYVFYFVKNNYWKASEDMTQLNRIAGEVNISVHEPNTDNSGFDDDRNDKVKDIKLHSSAAVVHIRYGTTVKQERKRLLKHAKKVTIRKAWSDEQEKVSAGLPGTIPWTSSEVEELLSHSSISSYSARYIHPPEDYPDLLDDPTNVEFYKDAKRTRRNSKSRRSHRCRRKWWKPFC